MVFILRLRVPPHLRTDRNRAQPATALENEQSDTKMSKRSIEEPEEDMKDKNYNMGPRKRAKHTHPEPTPITKAKKRSFEEPTPDINEGQDAAVRKTKRAKQTPSTMQVQASNTKATKGKKRSYEEPIPAINQGQDAAVRKTKRTKRDHQVQAHDDDDDDHMSDALASSPSKSTSPVDSPDDDEPASLSTLPVEITQKIAELLPTNKDVVNFILVNKSISRKIQDNSFWRVRFLQMFDDTFSDYGKTGLSDVQLREYKDKLEQRLKSLKTHTDFSRLGSGGHRREQKALVLMLREMIKESNAQEGGDARNHAFFEELVGRCAEAIDPYSPRKNTKGKAKLIEGKATGTNLVDLGPSIDIFRAKVIQELAEQPTQTQGRTRASKKKVIDHRNMSHDMIDITRAVQLCLAHISWTPGLCVTPSPHIDVSQRLMYAGMDNQLFDQECADKPDLNWFLHAVNFWRFHTKNQAEGGLGWCYPELPKSSLPRAWMGKLKEGTQALAPRWKGASAYLQRKDLRKLREGGPAPGGGTFNPQDRSLEEADEESISFPDIFERDGEDIFEDMIFDFSPRVAKRMPWLAEFEDYLESEPSAQNSAGKPIQFSAVDGEGQTYAGRIHALPPQQGIPGFQKFSMMRYHMTAEGSELDTDTTSEEPIAIEHIDYDDMWAYEGMILPGGNIIMGRWWSTGDNMDDDSAYSGPFCYWRVNDDVAMPTPEN